MSDVLTRTDSAFIDSVVNDALGAADRPLGEEAIGGAFDGARKYDQSLANFNPPSVSADMSILHDKEILDSRVEDMLRNDGYIRSARQLHRDNIVGDRYLLNARPKLAVLGLDEAWGKEFQLEVESKFGLAAESEDCWFDAAGKMTFTGIIRLVVGIYCARGEVLGQAKYLRGSRRPFKTAVQMIDLDRLETPYEHQADKRVRGGIRHDVNGRPLGAYIRNAHKSDFLMQPEDMDYTFIPARKPWGRQQLMYLLDADRPDQSRGVSEIVAGLKELHITKSFRNVTLQNAVVNATIAASIESELPSETVFAQMGAGRKSKSEGGAVAKYGQDYLGAVAQYSGDKLKIDGAKIPHLFPGTKLKLHPAGSPGGVGQDFEKGLLRYISALLGVSYEQLSRDYSETNYSSARAAMNETWKFMQSRKRMVADRWANMIYALWLEEQINSGGLETMRGRSVPNFYDPLMKEAYAHASWIGAGRGEVDPLKERQADVLAVKYRLMTREEYFAKHGKDYREEFAQMEREETELSDRGLTVEESNTINAVSGAPREQENDGTDSQDGG